MARRTPQTVVGRERELALLASASSRALAGQPATVLVVGDAGIGKSRLVEAAISRLPPDVCVLRANCTDTGDLDVPFVPFMAMVAQLADHRGPGADHLGRFPDLALLTGRHVPARGPAPDEPTAPQRMFVSLAGLFDALAVAHPTVVVIDDLHWADPSSVTFLSYLLRNLRRGSLLVLLTSRPDGAPFPLAEWQRLDVVERVDLAPLGREDVAVLAAGIRGAALTEAEIDLLMARAGGNPLLTEELVRAGHIIEGLPTTLVDTVSAQLHRLQGDPAELLRRLAVLGRDADMRLIERLADLPADRLSAALDAIVRSRVVQVDQGTHYRFRHALLAEAVDASLTPAVRRQLHTRVAEVLVGHPELTDDVRRDADLARHWRSAGDLHRALGAHARAARQAAHLLGPATAFAHWRAAAELWPLVRDVEAPPNTTLPEILVRAAEAARLAGWPADAARWGHRAAEEAARQGEGRVEIEARCWQIESLIATGRIAEGASLALATVEQARARARDPGPDATVARAMSLACRVLTNSGDMAGLLELAPEALSVCERADSPRHAAGVLVSEGTALLASNRVLEGVARMDDALRRAVAAGAFDAAWNVSYSQVVVAPALRDSAGCLDVAQRCFRIADEHRLPGDQAAHGRVLIADAQLRRGAVESARAHLDAVTRYALHTIQGRFEAVLTHAATLLEEGRPGEAQRVLDRQDDAELAEMPVLRLRHGITAARVALRSGDPARALDLVETGLARVTIPILLLHGSWAAATGIEAAVAAGAPPARIRALAEGSARVHAAVEIPEGVVTPRDAWHEIALAWAATADDRTPGRWAAAVTACERTGARLDAAWCRLQQAAAALVNGDREAAAAALSVVCSEANAMGAALLGRTADDVARRARIALDGRPQSTGSLAFALTERELDVLRLLGDGCTNPEIGARLFISAKTASVHVSNLMRKLGVANRREAARLARSAGLLTP